MATQQQISQAATLGGAAAASTVAAILGPAAAAGPIGIAIGGAVLAITALSGTISKLINGCGQSCVQATQIVNEADTYVQQMAAAYWQAPVRTVSFRDWTLEQMDAVFNQVRELCGRIGGDAGTNCVKERLTRGYPSPWCAPAGLPIGPQCGGWYDVTYDPIMHDPGVQPDPGPMALLSSGLPGGYGTMFIAGAALFAFIAYKVRT